MSRNQYIYGRHPVAEAIKGRARDVRRVFVARSPQSSRVADLERMAEARGIPLTVVPKRKLDDLVGPVPHQGVVAAVVPFGYVDLTDVLDRARGLDQPPLVVALDHVQDPHNFGALARSTHALGGHGMVVPKDRSAEVTPAVVKASAGATSHLPIAQVTNLTRALNDLRDAGLWLIGAAAEGSEALPEVDLTGPIVIVVGSEGRGLRRLVARSCDRLVHIPMKGTLGSLNAAVAGAIFLYEAARQRQQVAG